METITKQITFPLQLPGSELTATLSEVIDNPPSPVHFWYHVAFSDDFSDDFILREDTTSLTGSKPGWQTYAKALENDIRIIPAILDAAWYRVFSVMHNSNRMNVWIIKEAGDNYRVYY